MDEPPPIVDLPDDHDPDAWCDEDDCTECVGIIIIAAVVVCAILAILKHFGVLP